VHRADTHRRVTTAAYASRNQIQANIRFHAYSSSMRGACLRPEPVSPSYGEQPTFKAPVRLGGSSALPSNGVQEAAGLASRTTHW
jgi:hypothetical protein